MPRVRSFLLYRGVLRALLLCSGGCPEWVVLRLHHPTCFHCRAGACVRNNTAQISSSIFLAGNWDYMDWYNNGSSNCLTMVDK